MEVLFRQLVLIPPSLQNCWRTNKEAEAAKAAYHHNKSSLGAGGGGAWGGGAESGRRGSAAQSRWGWRRRSEGVAKEGRGRATPCDAAVSLLRSGSVSSGGV